MDKLVYYARQRPGASDLNTTITDSENYGQEIISNLVLGQDTIVSGLIGATSVVPDEKLTVSVGIAYQSDGKKCNIETTQTLKWDGSQGQVADSTYDRIDIVCIQHTYLDGDVVPRYFIDNNPASPTFGQQVTQNVVVNKYDSFKFLIQPGTPSASPAIPPLPSGYIPLFLVYIKSNAVAPYYPTIQPTGTVHVPGSAWNATIVSDIDNNKYRDKRHATNYPAYEDIVRKKYIVAVETGTVTTGAGIMGTTITPDWTLGDVWSSLTPGATHKDYVVDILGSTSLEPIYGEDGLATPVIANLIFGQIDDATPGNVTVNFYKGDPFGTHAAVTPPGLKVDCKLIYPIHVSFDRLPYDVFRRQFASDITYDSNVEARLTALEGEYPYSSSLMGVESDTFVVDSNDSSVMPTLQLGLTYAKTLGWINANSRFEFNDNVHSIGELTLDGNAITINNDNTASQDMYLRFGTAAGLNKWIKWDNAGSLFNTSTSLAVTTNVRVVDSTMSSLGFSDSSLTASKFAYRYYHNSGNSYMAVYNSLSGNLDHIIVTGNNSASIIAAIGALPAGGGKIRLLNQTYTLTGTVTVNKEVVMEGCGTSTILLGTGLANTTMVSVTSDNVVLKEFTLKASTTAGGSIADGGDAIVTANSSGTFEKLSILNTYGRAIACNAGDNTISNCTISNCGNNSNVSTANAIGLNSARNKMIGCNLFYNLGFTIASDWMLIGAGGSNNLIQNNTINWTPGSTFGGSGYSTTMIGTGGSITRTSIIANRIIITDNFGTSAAVRYLKGIYVGDCDETIVSENTIYMSVNGTWDTVGGIQNAAGDKSNINNNNITVSITSSSTVTNTYGIWATASCPQNTIVGNNVQVTGYNTVATNYGIYGPSNYFDYSTVTGNYFYAANAGSGNAQSVNLVAGAASRISFCGNIGRYKGATWTLTNITATGSTEFTTP